MGRPEHVSVWYAACVPGETETAHRSANLGGKEV
jgi:hypothetical protein